MKRAFTLIELLTVIAIIGILAAILIPVVSSVRQSARSSKSIANLREIATATNLYAEENNGFFPFMNFFGTGADADEQPGAGGGNTRWPVVLEPYLGHDVERQADNPVLRHPIFNDPTVPESERDDVSDYAANWNVFLTVAIASRDRNGRAFRMPEVRDPSMKGMIVTGTSWQFRVGTLVGGDSEWVGGGDPGPPDPRLSSGAFGVAFIDGHVKAIRNEGEYAADVEVRRMMWDPTR